MKEIEFSEDQLNNLDLVAALMFADPTDPTSTSYDRKLVRPAINWLKIIALCLLTAAVTIGACYVLVMLGVAPGLALALSLLGLAGFLFLSLKRILICMVHIYQRYAPASVRKKCRFEPSCSEYMIQSLEKYGLFRGLKKGINRLNRCDIPNGGFDYP